MGETPMPTVEAGSIQAAALPTNCLVNDGLATVPEAAEFLSVSKGTIYNLMERGELKYAKIGRNRRIPWAALKALAAASMVDA
jgi:excisionase family DNA binding protein